MTRNKELNHYLQFNSIAMILNIQNLSKYFQSPAQEEPVEVLKALNVTLRGGETLAIVGESGSGKSTLLSLLAGLDKPTFGTIEIDGQNINEMPENRLAKFRAANIGIVFQQFHLMSHLNAVENISLPLELLGNKDAQALSMVALEQVTLSHRYSHFPHQMSGGECQRVAIARAMVTKPRILLADEPTGNLDNKTGEHVAKLFFDLVAQTRMTLILVTHNEKLANRCQRKLKLENGCLHETMV